MQKVIDLLQKVVTRIYQRRVLSVSFLAPITTAQVLDFTGNVAAIRNGGTSTILLNMGQWTLLPGESLHFGSQTDFNNIDMRSVGITFDTSTGVINRLQILEVGVKLC